MSPIFIVPVLLISSIVAAASAAGNSYPYPEPKRVMINSYVLARCMAGATKSYGNRAHFEPEHIYPNNYRNRYPLAREFCEFRTSMFFDYLSAEKSRICDYETGVEPKLRQWILAQPDNTIDPLKLFRQALSFNEGHVFNAILTIHQLLRNEARWFSKKYYAYASDEGSSKVFWEKFVDIRGDLAELGGRNEGDHRGSWYRFWGMMMYRLTLRKSAHSSRDVYNCEHSGSSTLSGLIADLQSSAVAISAELIKYLPIEYSAGGDRAGKARVNSAGSQTGSALINAIEDGNDLNPDALECSKDRILLKSLF